MNAVSHFHGNLFISVRVDRQKILNYINVYEMKHITLCHIFFNYILHCRIFTLSVKFYYFIFLWQKQKYVITFVHQETRFPTWPMFQHSNLKIITKYKSLFVWRLKCGDTPGPYSIHWLWLLHWFCSWSSQFDSIPLSGTNNSVTNLNGRLKLVKRHHFRKTQFHIPWSSSHFVHSQPHNGSHIVAGLNGSFLPLQSLKSVSKKEKKFFSYLIYIFNF